MIDSNVILEIVIQESLPISNNYLWYIIWIPLKDCKLLLTKLRLTFQFCTKGSPTLYNLRQLLLLKNEFYKKLKTFKELALKTIQHMPTIISKCNIYIG